MGVRYWRGVPQAEPPVRTRSHVARAAGPVAAPPGWPVRTPARDPGVIWERHPGPLGR